MQGLELRVVALGKKLRSVALEYGFDLNEAGLIVHEACLYILRALPDATQPIARTRIIKRRRPPLSHPLCGEDAPSSEISGYNRHGPQGGR